MDTRQTEFRSKDQAISRKLREELAWWRDAEYVKRSMDWKDRVALQVSHSYIVERRWRGINNDVQSDTPTASSDERRGSHLTTNEVQKDVENNQDNLVLD